MFIYFLHWTAKSVSVASDKNCTECTCLSNEKLLTTYTNNCGNCLVLDWIYKWIIYFECCFILLNHLFIKKSDLSEVIESFRGSENRAIFKIRETTEKQFRFPKWTTKYCHWFCKTFNNCFKFPSFIVIVLSSCSYVTIFHPV